MEQKFKISFFAIFFIAAGLYPLFGQENIVIDQKKGSGDVIEPVITKPAPVKAAKAVGNAAKAASSKKKGDKENAPRVVFAPTNNRDPFLSMEEVDTIEKARLAEQKRIADEKKRLEELEKQRRAELEEQRRREEELKRNPARAIIDKIKIDGILGNEAIINGEVVPKGGTVLGAQVIKITDNAVTFVYKGQKFVKKLPLM